MLTLLRQKLYAAAVVIATLIAFPVFVPLQTWHVMTDDVHCGRTHWCLATLFVLVGCIGSLAMALFGLSLLLIPALLIASLIA